MELGYSLLGMNPKAYPQVVRTAEECGFDSVWVPEHLVYPAEIPPVYPYLETSPAPVPGTRLYDPWVTLGWLAAATTKLRLGTQIYILPLRHPLVTAKAITTLDVLSDGRAVLGVGVGWLAEEFQLAGQDFEHRGKRTDEIIGILRKLWSEKVIEHSGEFYEMEPFRFEPKPVQKPHPPILVGGEARPALRRAAKLGDGWISATFDFETLEGNIAQLSELRAEYGRENDPFELISTTPADASSDDIQRRRDLGLTTLVFTAPMEPGVRLTADVVCADIERRANDYVKAR